MHYHFRYIQIPKILVDADPAFQHRDACDSVIGTQNVSFLIIKIVYQYFNYLNGSLLAKNVFEFQETLNHELLCFDMLAWFIIRQLFSRSKYVMTIFELYTERKPNSK